MSFPQRLKEKPAKSYAFFLSNTSINDKLENRFIIILHKFLRDLAFTNVAMEISWKTS